MFLKHRPSQCLIEVLSLNDLWDPFILSVVGRSHAGEELQEPEIYSKDELEFLSGESLPQCWVNVHYRDGADAKPPHAVVGAR